MITFFTIPKPFKDKTSVIQRNAIISWLQLHPDCEIILYGDEEGISEIAHEFGLIHIPGIKKNEYGTPFLDFVFSDAQSRAKNNILCYANTDIIFFKDFISSIQSLRIDQFLAIGQRWDIDITYALSFSDGNWENELRSMVNNYGKCLGPLAIDYFVFSRTTPLRLLPFLVGRRGWDNWVIYHARKKGVPVIDITQTATVIHQNHDYTHVPLKKGEKWDGPESEYNVNLTGNKMVQKSNLLRWSINDAEYILTDRGLEKKQKGIKIKRKIILFFPEFFYPVLAFIFLTVVRRIVNIRKKIWA